jgi:asparagine synthase (glutamine-hydrolysing)
MSVQFGIWRFHGEPVPPSRVRKMKDTVARWGADAEGAHMEGDVALLHHAFHTTHQSRHETQPHVSPSGAVLTWDGRLDNSADLACVLRDLLPTDASDASIAAAAYERWGADCLGRLIGDWALVIWNPRERTLLLARDFVGSRHLYYALEKNGIIWSTVLDSLVTLTGHPLALEEEYIAGWLTSFPAAHLTPFVGICAVPPCGSVLVKDGSVFVRTYWNFPASKQIRYRTDGEYQEHFLRVFSDAVRKRLRSDSPVLAELSGGMDSSSIVCVADMLITQGFVELPRLDTVSYYIDSEPDWDERPFFTLVEKQRGRRGCHIDAASQWDFLPEYDQHQLAATPASLRRSSQFTSALTDLITSQGYRVLLSGIGGDEVLGGVPAPTPELADLLVAARFRTLGRQLLSWALASRKPLLHLLAETLKTFLPMAVAGASENRQAPFWADRTFASRHRKALGGYLKRTKLFGPRPSFQQDLAVLEALRRQIACIPVPSQPVFQRLYPFLDRDLLQFLFAIPREQLVRPGQRRSLMRRSLVGIVPPEILNRKRKAYVARRPMTAISKDGDRLMNKSDGGLICSEGFVDREVFHEALERVRKGHQVPVVPLQRTLQLEAWLENIRLWLTRNRSTVSLVRDHSDCRSKTRVSLS